MTPDADANRSGCDLPLPDPDPPLDEIARELGIAAEQVVRLDSNENPLGPSPRAQAAMREALDQAHRYPEAAGHRLRAALAASLGLAPSQLVLGNGSTEILELLGHAFLHPTDEVVTTEHAFVMYRLVASRFGARCVEVPDTGFVPDLEALAEAISPRTRLVFIANPNNPTGTAVGQGAIDRLLGRLPGSTIAVFDEAYHEYLERPPDTLAHVRAGRSVCVLRTFSKIHGLAALRVGYGAAPAPVAALLERARLPFAVNAIAQAGALAALTDAEHLERTRAMNRAGLADYERAFTERGLPYVPSRASFILVRTGEGDAVCRGMRRHGVLVRAMEGYRLPEWVRISVGTPAQNRRCLAALDAVLAERRRAPPG